MIRHLVLSSVAQSYIAIQLLGHCDRGFFVSNMDFHGSQTENIQVGLLAPRVAGYNGANF